MQQVQHTGKEGNVCVANRVEAADVEHITMSSSHRSTLGTLLRQISTVWTKLAGAEQPDQQQPASECTVSSL